MMGIYKVIGISKATVTVKAINRFIHYIYAAFKVPNIGVTIVFQILLKSEKGPHIFQTYSSFKC